MSLAVLLLAVGCPRDGSSLDPDDSRKSAAGAPPLEIVLFGNSETEARGKAHTEGAQLAAALAPAVLDRRIRIRLGGPPTGRALARAAGDADVIAAITIGGESAIPNAAVALDERLLPVFDVADDLYEAGVLRASVFQMRTPHSWSAWRLARYFGPGDRAYKKVAILREAVPSTDPAAASLGIAMQERGIELVDALVEPNSGEAAISREVEKLVQSRPQAVVLEGSEAFVSDAAKVMQTERWDYRGRQQIDKGWHPQVAGFESLLLTDVVLAEGTVAAGDYALALPPSESMSRVEGFVKSFSERFDERPRADGWAAYDAVRLAVEAVRGAGKLDRTAVLQALETVDRKQFAHTPASFGPSDHVAAERDVQGLWTVKRNSASLARFERWTLLMRTFTSDLERTNILEEDWPSFFEGTTPGGEAPFFYQAKSGVVSKKEDQTH